MNNPDDDIPDEAAGMLAHEAQNAGHLANGSSGHTLAEQVGETNIFGDRFEK